MCLGSQEAQELQEGVWEGVPARPEGDVPLRPLSAADGAWTGGECVWLRACLRSFGRLVVPRQGSSVARPWRVAPVCALPLSAPNSTPDCMLYPMLRAVECADGRHGVIETFLYTNARAVNMNTSLLSRLLRYAVREPHFPHGLAPTEPRSHPSANKLRDNRLHEPAHENDHSCEDWVAVENH